MTTTAMPRPRPNGDNRWRTAEQHILAMVTVKPEDAAIEADLARRAVQRLDGQNATEILDMLGLATTEPASVEGTPEPEPEKRCSSCKTLKAQKSFTRCANTSDGFYPQCRDCRNASRRKLYARTGYRELPNSDGNIDWATAPRAGLGVPCSRDAVESRISAWAALRIEEELAPRKSAERMGVSMRSARRYDRILKDRGLLPETDESGRVVAAA